MNLETSDVKPVKEVMRIGAYGVAINDGKILLVTHRGGPYMGQLDFPGGGIEFGESVEQALRREFIEEVAMEFDTLRLLENLTAIVNITKTTRNEPYIFHQIGLIYAVNNVRPTSTEPGGDLKFDWFDPNSLTVVNCAPLLWQFIKSQFDFCNPPGIKAKK